MEKYLALNTLKIIASWLEINFYSCFPSIDKLKARRNLNLRPPKSFSTPQLIQWIPLELFFKSHQKEFFIFWRLSSKVEGKRKTLMQYKMQYKGIA